MNTIDKFLLEFKWRDKLRILLLFLFMCIAFSIPFGHEYGRKIIILAFIVWLFVVKKEDLIYFLKHRVIIVLFLFLVMHYISLLWSEHLKDGLYYIRILWMYIFTPLFIYATTMTKYSIKYIISAFIFGMLINEVISYLIYFDLYQTELSKINRWPVGFIHHITYSVFVSFSAILILFQAKNLKNKYIKFLYITFFITMTINLIISGGRTGYVVYFTSLIILLFSYYKINWKNFLQLLLFPTFVFIIGYKLNEDVQKRIEATIIATKNASNNANYDSSFGARLAFYPLSLDILKQDYNSYIFGVGTGDIPSELLNSIKRTKLLSSKHTHTHNSYMEAYLNVGVVGLVLLIMFFYFIWKIKVKNKEILFIKQLIVINISVSVLSDRIFNITESMFFLSIFFALVLAQEKIEKKEMLTND